MVHARIVRGRGTSSSGDDRPRRERSASAQGDRPKRAPLRTLCAVHRAYTSPSSCDSLLPRRRVGEPPPPPPSPVPLRLDKGSEGGAGALLACARRALRPAAALRYCWLLGASWLKYNNPCNPGWLMLPALHLRRRSRLLSRLRLRLTPLRLRLRLLRLRRCLLFCLPGVGWQRERREASLIQGPRVGALTTPQPLPCRGPALSAAGGRGAGVGCPLHMQTCTPHAELHAANRPSTGAPGPRSLAAALLLVLMAAAIVAVVIRAPPLLLFLQLGATRAGRGAKGFEEPGGCK